MHKFSHIIKVTVFALGIAIFGLAPAAQAMSERNNHKQGNRHSYNNNGNKHHYNKRSNHRNYNKHNSRKYSYNRHSKSRYGYRSNRHYYSGGYYNSHRRHHSGHGGEVALGLLTGGLLFYALTANERSSYNDRTVYVQQQPTYVQPTQQQRVAQPENVDTSCLQVREYQTTITVGNQSVPAYGQSCLQPDGSWKLGPAIPEPGY